MNGVVRYRAGDATALGVLSGDGQVLPVNEQSWAELFESGGPSLAKGASAVGRVELLCPIARPGKVVCTGVNYASHKTENPTAVLPRAPFFFSKLPNSVISRPRDRQAGTDDPARLRGRTRGCNRASVQTSQP